MLKRKSYAQVSENIDESVDNAMNTHQEINQRKIFRARRPIRSVSKDSPSKFKITSQLVSLEEEVRLLSLHNRPQGNMNIHHMRTRSENPYRFDSLSTYGTLDPFKEIIQNLNVADESNMMKGFLDSNVEKKKNVARFTGDCSVVINEDKFKGSCQLHNFKETGLVYFTFKTPQGKILVNKQITRETTCKELSNQLISIFLLTFAPEDSLEVKMITPLKHLFFRSFSESKQHC